jgi:crotonobetainyl-CoA:carnitine CoA-transferase CaiB-like acyl-CoA transferase
MSIQSHQYAQALDVDEEGPQGIYPYRLFETRDDRIFIGAPTNKFWQILCDAIGAPHLATDPKYDTNAKRVAHSVELIAEMEPHFRLKTTAEWEALLVEKGVPCGSVKHFHEFFDDPQVEAMEMNPVIEHETIGRMKVAGLPIHFEKTPGSIQRAAPLLGQHTEEILRELGYDTAAVEALRHEGVISD